MSDIFISYSSEDRDWARRLAQALEQEGWSVWWDRKIAVGKSYQRVKETELEAADGVIVIWSEHSVASDWVVAEAAEGRERNLLVPVSIDGAKPPLVFRQIQSADLSQWDGNPSSSVFRRLADDIRPIISDSKKGDAPDSAPPAPSDGKPFRWYALAIAVLVAIGLLAAFPYIKPLFDSEKPHIPPAQVSHFTAEPAQIETGGTTILRWQTRNAEKITLSTVEEAPGESIEPAGIKTVRPQDTTTFFLKVQGNDPDQNIVVERITVTVRPPLIEPDPRIVVYETDRRRLVRGEGTALHWETAHAFRVELDGRMVEPAGELDIRPDQTATYQLVAVNKSGKSDTKSITIAVDDLPRGEITEIQELLEILGYHVGLADGLPGPRTRAAVEAFQTEAGLPVTGLPSRYLAEKLRDVHRSVPPPDIRVFKSDRQKIPRGETLTLWWDTANADKVRLNPLGNVEVAGERPVQPEGTTEYELVATNRIGRSVRQTIVIHVDAPLKIESLTVDRQRIGPDDKTTIHWRTSGAARVELIPFGEVSLSGSQRVSPKKTTRYDLVATDAAGANLSRSVTVDVVRPPRIDFFKADKELVKPGDWVGLFWGTTDAETVAISTLGSVEKDGSKKVSPDKTTTYLLTARGFENQVIRAKVTISVKSD